MPIELSKSQLTGVIQGRSTKRVDGISFSGVHFDSREIRGGELFVALSGAESHGDKFVGSAFERGAAFCLCESAEFLEGEFADRVLVVSDSLAAFSKLASWWRQENGTKILALSGSVGKTSVKELMATILLEESLGSFTNKSFNNHVGVPYSLCQISRSHQWAVLELGMNHAGELTELTKFVQPDVALLTAIAQAHAGNFDSVREITKAKFELFSSLPEGAPIVLNADDPELTAYGEEMNVEERFEVFRFGKQDGCACRLVGIHIDLDAGMKVELELFGEQFSCETRLLGEHNARNIAAAALGAKLVRPEITSDQIIAGVKRSVAPPMRMESERLTTGRLLINDAYNANPGSMRAAIDFLARYVADGKSATLVAADMYELGEQSAALHEEVGRYAAEAGVESLIAVGEFAGDFIRGFQAAGGARFFEAPNPVAAAAILAKIEFDVVLLKGSRAMTLEKALDSIRHNEAIRSV